MLAAFATALFGCAASVPTPEECRSLSEHQAVAERCYAGNIETGPYVGDLKCFPFSKAKRLKGIWVTQTEVSVFFANAERVTPSMLGGGGDTWLDAVGAAKHPIDAAWDAGPGVFRVEFMGRESLCPTGYGHFGMSPNEVVAEQIISLVRLPDPRVMKVR